MGSVTALLAQARAVGLRISRRGDRLQVRGPRRLAPLVQQILDQKPAVMDVLARGAQSFSRTAVDVSMADATGLFSLACDPTTGGHTRAAAVAEIQKRADAIVTRAETLDASSRLSEDRTPLGWITPRRVATESQELPEAVGP